MGQNVEKIVGDVGRDPFEVIPRPSECPTEDERFNALIRRSHVFVRQQERRPSPFHEML